MLKIVAFLDCGEASERGRILNNFLQWAGIISSTEGLGEAAGVVYFPGAVMALSRPRIWANRYVLKFAPMLLSYNWADWSIMK